MTSRRFSLILTALAIAWVAPARGQNQDKEKEQDKDKHEADCRKAIKDIKDDDDEHGRNDGHRDQHDRGKAEKRQLAVARLLTCGVAAGPAAASTIRSMRNLTDTATLAEMVGPYRNFRDTAVLNAAMSVADDRSASVPARAFALRTLWILRTGEFWIGYDRMLPASHATAENPDAVCGAGVNVTDARPYWVEGATPAPGFEAGILAFAERLRADTSQPLAVRAAATCVLHHHGSGLAHFLLGTHKSVRPRRSPRAAGTARAHERVDLEDLPTVPGSRTTASSAGARCAC